MLLTVRRWVGRRTSIRDQVGPQFTAVGTAAEGSRASWISLFCTTAPSAPPLSNFHHSRASSNTDPNAAAAPTAAIAASRPRTFHWLRIISLPP